MNEMGQQVPPELFSPHCGMLRAEAGDVKLLGI